MRIGNIEGAESFGLVLAAGIADRLAADLGIEAEVAIEDGNLLIKLLGEVPERWHDLVLLRLGRAIGPNLYVARQGEAIVVSADPIAPAGAEEVEPAEELGRAGQAGQESEVEVEVEAEAAAESGALAAVMQTVETPEPEAPKAVSQEPEASVVSEPLPKPPVLPTATSRSSGHKRGR